MNRRKALDHDYLSEATSAPMELTTLQICVSHTVLPGPTIGIALIRLKNTDSNM